MRKITLSIACLLLSHCGQQQSNNLLNNPPNIRHIPVIQQHQFTDLANQLLIQNNVNISLYNAHSCLKNSPCITITNQKLDYINDKLIVGQLLDNHQIIVSSYNRKHFEVSETIIHEIGHLFTLKHSSTCNNIMTPDFLCNDSRTLFNQQQINILNKE